MNRYNRPSLPKIGGEFTLSQRERAGVRESRCYGNALPEIRKCKNYQYC